MSNKNLFKEAIADAKAVREAALANAKAALEEALTPKLQSMLAAKLNEMDYEGEVEDLEDDAEMEEGMYPEDTSDEIQDRYRATGAALEEEMDEESMDEDFDLSEILAELDEEEISEPFTDEEPHMDIKGTERGYVKEAKETEEEESEESEEESEEEETEEVADMSVEDLKALIKDIVSQEMGGEEKAGEEMSMDIGSEKAEEESDEINLDELLAELDAMGKDEEMEEGILGKIGGAIKKGAQAIDYATGGNPKDCIERGLKAGPKGFPAYFAEINKCRKEKGLGVITTAKAQGFDSTGGEMSEAIRTINILRSELNEVNLLNAKLLYVNKIFKAKNLSESQKLKVIASFDKATTAKEAKVVFESLNANLNASAPKQAIKESLGFASRAAGVAPRKAIVETNDAITRMQKLANIIK